MAHFAQLDANNVVTQVIVVNNSELGDLSFPESEFAGVEFCRNLFGGTWKQTSYNANFRKHYAGIGYAYDASLDAFIPPQPYPSWSLDSDCKWQAPVAMPTDGKLYSWNEAAQAWNEVTAPSGNM